MLKHYYPDIDLSVQCDAFQDVGSSYATRSLNSIHVSRTMTDIQYWLYNIITLEIFRQYIYGRIQSDRQQIEVIAEVYSSSY